MRTGSAAIIGGGAAGLAAAKALLVRGVACTVFERNEVPGGVWADGYSNFGVQVQRELYELPDWPLPPDAPDFTPGPVIQSYLAGYARRYGVWPRIRFGATVTHVVPRAAGGGFELAWREGDAEHARGFDRVVVCTGLYSSRPHCPPLSGQERFEGEILHVSALKDRQRLAGMRVAVIGFGKSATDAALEAAAVAAETTIVLREPHWPVPPLVAGVLPFKWAMLNRLASTLIPLHYRPSSLERCVHSLGRPLAWLWWRLVEQLLIAQYGLRPRGGSRTSLVPRKPIEFDAFGESVMLPRPAFYRAVRAGRIRAVISTIDRLEPRAAILGSGERLALDAVVLATGWETDHDFLSAEIRAALGFEDDGLYLYRQMVHPAVPGLAFVGYAATISSLLTYSLQAHWLAELVAGRHALPPAADMEQDIAEQRAWKRRTMPYSRGRAARLLLYMQHYHDALVADLGESPLRKTGLFAPFKEVFAPYVSRDYRSLVAGRLADAAAPATRPPGTPGSVHPDPID